jgi:type I restriction enzyme S subunit
MNKIQSLINELCPNGVEFKKLGEVADIMRGRRLTKSQLSSSNKYPVYHGGLEPLGYYGHYNRAANTVMVINVGASAGTVGYSLVDFWSSDGCFCIRHSDLFISRFLYYALLCQENLLRSKVRTAGIPTLDSTVVEKVLIPLPPLAIQQEIVNILDKFTELEAELEARRKRYEHYRSKLLTFSVLNENKGV